jgi:hypothetical protein
VQALAHDVYEGRGFTSNRSDAMPNRPRLMLAALLVSLVCSLASCNVSNDPNAAEWRRYNDITSERNCC